MVEFAIVAPVFFLFTFVCIEFARVNMLRNTAEIAATEGVRAGVVPGATAEACRTEAIAELAVLGVTGYQIQVTPTRFDVSTNSIRVAIDVPLTVANGYVLTPLFLGRTLSTSIELRREQ